LVKGLANAATALA
jgi:large subunit ribosomal protein L11